MDQRGFVRPDGTVVTGEEIVAGSNGETPDSGEVGIHTGSAPALSRSRVVPLQRRS